MAPARAYPATKIASGTRTPATNGTPIRTRRANRSALDGDSTRHSFQTSSAAMTTDGRTNWTNSLTCRCVRIKANTAAMNSSSDAVMNVA